MVTAFVSGVRSIGQSLRAPAQTLNRAQSVRETQQGLATRYDFWRAVYGNEAYGDLSAAQQFGSVWAGYPKSLRPISLIGKVAVDWWASQVYTGVWTRDGLRSSSGKPNLLPYDDETPPELRVCVQQAFSWCDPATFLRSQVHTGAMLGDVFAEVEVHYNEDGDPRSNKVYPVLQDPAHVVELSLNARGDVKSYRLAIPRYDELRKTSYLWGKLVTKQEITTYYDDEPHSYVEGQPATIPNRWGFVAAVFTKHQAAGGLHGAPVMDVVVSTVAEYDATLSTVNDYIHRFARQGALLATKDPKKAQEFLWGSQSRTSEGYQTDAIRQQAAARDRETINVWPVPEDVKLYKLLDNPGLEEADPHLSRIRAEIEEALPEIVFIRRMQEMDQVTKPGAVALVSQVQNKLDGVVSNYDHGTIKLGQMCAAIGGQLIRDGDWGLRSQLTPQQQKFLPFDLTSYAKDELDFDLQPRELLPKTRSELLDEAIKLESVQTATGFRYVGYSDDEIYGFDENGKPLAPDRKKSPGMLAADQAGDGVSADIGTALQQALNSGGRL